MGHGQSFHCFRSCRSGAVRYDRGQIEWLDRWAGVECAFTDTILGRIEYRYTNLEALGFGDVVTNSANVGTRAPISDLHAGIAYKLW